MTEHPPYTTHWLDEVEGEQALAWVAERNAHSHAALAQSAAFHRTEERIREILDDERKIAFVTEREGLLYNFWRDKCRQRGVWRRTTWESYRTGSPQWEVLLDLDALAKEEDTPWVWHGVRLLRPACERALVTLSPGGSDADVTREFDLRTKQFVENGFVRPLAKGEAVWADDSGDTVLLATERGEGTLTESGYPRTVAVWRRGEPLADAVVVAEAGPQDMFMSVRHSRAQGYERDVLTQVFTFYTSRTAVVPGGFAAYEDPRDAPVIWLDVPQEHDVVPTRDLLLVRTRQEWEVGGQTFPSGALVAFDLEAYIAGVREPHALFVPTAKAALVDFTRTQHVVVLTIVEDVVPRAEAHYRTADGWAVRAVAVPGAAQEPLSFKMSALHPSKSDDVWLTTNGFLTPTTFSRLALSAEGEVAECEVLASSPAHFSAEGMDAKQLFATSADGTRVPYWVITPAGFVADGQAPAILWGYGGFEVSVTPGYLGIRGATWVAEGGVYAIANIRGGGEYGPQWHEAALKERRHKAYEDFVAVARDLVARGFTSHARLGAQGGSNGGLLMGNMLTQYPELFGAIVCQVPLLDMRRYHKLLAGASWMAEYGDPEKPEEWEFISTFSPYHLFDPARDYPPILFTTSTRDDRVHPAHARTMAEQMLAAGKDVTYYENVEGGHGGASTNKQVAYMHALENEFFRNRLM